MQLALKFACLICIFIFPVGGCVRNELTLDFQIESTPSSTPPLVSIDAEIPSQTSHPLSPMGLERAFPNLTFQHLTNLTQPDDGLSNIFVTEQAGRVMVFSDDHEVSEGHVFLDIRERVSTKGTEEGLLGFTFDPGFNNNGYFYVYYSAETPRRSVLSRFSRELGNPRMANSQSERILMEILQPFGNHNGGQIAFGQDGYLYIGLGDGGGRGDPMANSQNIGTLLGAILRIEVNNGPDNVPYFVPDDNPYVGVSGARREIWAHGVRNPWRFSFDRVTGMLWVGDVGQNDWEEVNIVKKGLNYGWNILEGNYCFLSRTNCDSTGFEPPILEYNHSDGCSITGGIVYRGTEIPSLTGAYIYGDYCSGKIWGLRYAVESITDHALLVDSDLRVSSFGEDLIGNVYVLSRTKGIYRLKESD